MKLLVLLVLCCVISVGAYAVPSRDSMKVSDVTEAYNPDWIIGPTEESVGDHQVSNASECDIRGIISCYDDNQLRVDILLNSSVTKKVDVWYAVKFEYTDVNEYYTYYPSSNTLVYEKEKKR